MMFESFGSTRVWKPSPPAVTNQSWFWMPPELVVWLGPPRLKLSWVPP